MSIGWGSLPDIAARSSDWTAALPVPTMATVFEVVIGGRVYRIAGSALKRWIVERRNRLNGPKGILFSQRPTLE
jgi:hypothetical protein